MIENLHLDFARASLGAAAPLLIFVLIATVTSIAFLRNERAPFAALPLIVVGPLAVSLFFSEQSRLRLDALAFPSTHEAETILFAGTAENVTVIWLVFGVLSLALLIIALANWNRSAGAGALLISFAAGLSAVFWWQWSGGERLIAATTPAPLPLLVGTWSSELMLDLKTWGLMPLALAFVLFGWSLRAFQRDERRTLVVTAVVVIPLIAAHFFALGEAMGTLPR